MESANNSCTGLYMSTSCCCKWEFLFTIRAAKEEPDFLEQHPAFTFISYIFYNFVGGMVLHKGEIAEMRTGEGKTLVAVLPAYLNALSGKGVYVVTVNDYLARRDCEWVGQVPRFLGLKVGLIQRM